MCASLTRRRGRSSYSAKPAGGRAGPSKDQSPITAPLAIPIPIIHQATATFDRPTVRESSLGTLIVDSS